MLDLLVLLCVVGFVALVAVAIIVGLVNEVVEFYRRHFGVEGEYWRTREELEEEQERYLSDPKVLSNLLSHGVRNLGAQDFHDSKTGDFYVLRDSMFLPDYLKTVPRLGILGEQRHKRGN